MKLLALIVLSLFSSAALACGGSGEKYRFLYFPEPGPSATKDGSGVRIDTRFVDELIESPSHDLYLENSQELFYLTVTGDEASQHAAARTLAYLIANPRYEEPCAGGDAEVAYGVEELAFVFSRTDLSGLCKISGAERDAIVGYYKARPDLRIGPEDPAMVRCDSERNATPLPGDRSPD